MQARGFTHAAATQYEYICEQKVVLLAHVNKYNWSYFMHIKFILPSYIGNNGHFLQRETNSKSERFSYQLLKKIRIIVGQNGTCFLRKVCSLFFAGS